MSTSKMASMSSKAVSQTLLSITGTKINEVSKKMKAFDAQKKAILYAVQAEADQSKKVELLLDGLKSVRNSFSSVNPDVSTQFDLPADLSGVSTENIRSFLDQSKYDPSISPSLLKDWESQLKLDLEMQGVKYDYAYFFGRLVTEWLTHPDTRTAIPPGEEANSEVDVPMDMDSFVAMGRKEMYEQRELWESYVFRPKETDVNAIEVYLSKLFTSSKESRVALEGLRDCVSIIGTNIPAQELNIGTVKRCIKSLLSSDLFSDEKRAILMEFSINDMVLTEVADVLKLRLTSIDTWAWDPEGVPIEIRRKLNGKYRIFMDEDILDALFLEYIGGRWGGAFHAGLEDFVSSTAWKKLSNKPMTTLDRLRREYFLGLEASEEMKKTVQNRRFTNYEDSYFMTLLPDSTGFNKLNGYDSVDDTLHDNAESGADDIARAGADDTAKARADDTPKSGAALKQSLLHLLFTELLLNTQLYGQFTIIQSDFNWFGPSLPHSSIFAVLKFFGVPQQWITFFERFLEAPIKFIQDGANAQVRRRKRGTPLSHALSAVFGEVVLFCMDFAVNQGTDGAILYRLHDDFWFWGQEQTCVNAWREMTNFADVIGLSFNEKKTGCVQIRRKGSEASDILYPVGSLPKGEIRWGFLKLDPSTGNFIIDQNLVDLHTAELKLQLSACESVFGWVQAWNSYLAKFFVFNLCQPAHCFGRQHLDKIIRTFQSIQQSLFGDVGGSVTEYLKKVIFERFGMTGVPDGFFYFPVDMGGLGLHNPFISLFVMRDSICKEPDAEFEKVLEEVEDDYREAKEAFENGQTFKNRKFQPSLVPENPDVFMELEEFTRYLEETSKSLYWKYEYLLSVPRDVWVQTSPQVATAIRQLPPFKSGNKNAINGTWNRISPYYQWVVELYARELMQKFGGLRIVDEGLLPIGVVRILQSKEMKWQG